MAAQVLPKPTIKKYFSGSFMPMLEKCTRKINRILLLLLIILYFVLVCCYVLLCVELALSCAPSFSLGPTPASRLPGLHLQGLFGTLGARQKAGGGGVGTAGCVLVPAHLRGRSSRCPFTKLRSWKHTTFTST